jgi:hypothetical protein
MKKTALLLSLVILMPALAFATPAETTGGAISTESYSSLKQYLSTKNYLHKKHENGLRSWEFKPYVYKQARLQDKNVGAHPKPNFPGIEYKKLCYHWKNCLKRVYNASNGYDKAYKKYTPKRVHLIKAKSRTHNRGQKNITLKDSRSGNYKLWNWTLRNRK